MINREIPQLLLYTVFPSSDVQRDAEIQGAPHTNTGYKVSTAEFKYIIKHQWKEKKKSSLTILLLKPTFYKKKSIMSIPKTY